MTQVKLLTDAIDDFIKGCKADGNWDQIKACCIMAAWDGLNGALVPIKGPAPTNVNFVSDDYDRVTGLKGDGSTKYLNSNRANDDDPQNSNHNAVYASFVGTFPFMSAESGNVDGSNQLGSGLVRNRTASSFSYTSPDEGLIGHSRNTSQSYVFRKDSNNIILSESSQSPTSNTLMLYTNDATNFANHRLSFYSIGESIDLSALDTRVTNLMTAIDGAIA